MSVTFIKWNKNGLCGAACAQMVLHALFAIGTTKAVQKTVWTRIKKHTNGHSTLTCTNVIFVPFANMIREACASGQRVLCWGTYPTSLEATLLDWIGPAANVTLQRTGSEDSANGIIQKCLKQGGIPIVLVSKGSHWVVVTGWDTEATKPVRVFDPAGTGPAELTVSYWNLFYMSAGDCGEFDNEFVVVEVNP